MEAKETVMDELEMRIVLNKASWESPTIPLSYHSAIAKEQAEISFKAGLKHGIWLFAWWKDGIQYVGTSGKTLQEAYKELGLD